jgi:tRNA U38,U39,U40 pseudouridine synthase TruA
MASTDGKEQEKSSSSAPPVSQKCSGCDEAFASRNAIFRHLRKTDGACLSGDDLEHFRKYMQSNDKGTKELILFGYMPVPGRISNGDDAATIMLDAIQQWQNGVNGTTSESSSPSDDASEIKYNRSYGNAQRGLAVAQDDNTGAVTEVLATRLQPIRGNRTVDEWLEQVQSIINAEFPSLTPCPVQILGRQEAQQAKKFNAELDVSHRRVNYLLPIDMISWNTPEFQHRLESLPTFLENNKHLLTHNHDIEPNLTDEETRIYLFQLKRIMQSLTTQIVELDVNDKAAVMEKGFSLQKRKGNSKKTRHGKKVKKDDKGKSPEENKDDSSAAAASQVVERQHILRRKRFHNFTPSVMAHEYLAYRRMDRFYHRATLAFPVLDPAKKPFIVLSITGDLFLTGQICRVVGLFVALANNLIDKEFLDCIFDEKYPHLIPTPPAPACGMVASEAAYMTWEGKLKSILSARSTDRYPSGWNQRSTLQRVKDWNDAVHEAMAKQWLSKGRDSEHGRLVAEKEWTESILLPWVEDAKRHLEEYRQWRKGQADQESETPQNSTAALDGSVEEAMNPIPPLESIDSSIPEAFSKVLYHLRKVDESGQWPSTTLKRQLVMVSTADTEEAKQNAPISLSMAHVKAKRNNKDTQSSAYSFVEGQGGASGSFSVGLMPGDVNRQPKSNLLFPELVNAAFALERSLFPDREPSSTIAINRNAQFRPHTDNGAGAGQSTSLIVALGTYSGGELLVEGDKHDIRYKAIEFNGWKQRHWTMPFVGERYSLVWFTPKGCEGMRGVDLDLSAAMQEETSMVVDEEES